MTKSDKAYEEYLQRFCNKHNLTREEAEKHLLVKEYKKWADKEYKDDD